MLGGRHRRRAPAGTRRPGRCPAGRGAARSAALTTRILGWVSRSELGAACGVVDGSAVVRVDEAVLPQLGALVDIRDAGHGQGKQLLAQRIAVRVRRPAVSPAASARRPPDRRAPRPASRARRPRTRCPDRSTRCATPLPGSPSRRRRAAADAARRSPSPSAGHTPKMFCHRNSPVSGSGDGVAFSQRVTNSAHSDGTWDSTPIRARTSSPRLVSWVDSVVIACGHRRARIALLRWNSAALTPKRCGSPPTSLSDTSRASR